MKADPAPPSIELVVARHTEFWRAVMGGVILLIVLLFPQGLVGGLKALVFRWQERRA